MNRTDIAIAVSLLAILSLAMLCNFLHLCV